MDEKGFTQMVNEIRIAEKAMGKVSYELTDKIKSGKNCSCSLYVAEDMKTEDVITEQNVRSVHPGNDLHPKYRDDIAGKK